MGDDGGLFVSLVDVGGIHAYITAAPRLRALSGASGRIARLNEADTFDLLAGCVGPSGNWTRGTGKWDLDPGASSIETSRDADWEVIYSTGGTTIAVIRGRERARIFCTAIERHYWMQTGGLVVTAEYAPWDGRSSTFGASLDCARTAVFERKHAGGAHGESTAALFTEPHVAICDECGQHPAVGHRSLPDSKRRICRACELRYEEAWVGDRDRTTWLESRVDQLLQGVDSVIRAASIDRLVPERGRIAVIAVDGNGTGALLREAGVQGKDAYAQLSRQLIDRTRASLTAALKEAKGGQAMVLIWGGDDVLFVVPAESGLQAAGVYCETYAKGGPAGGATPNGARFSAAAGVVFAKPSFPFAMLADLAFELMRNAKRAAKRACPGAGAIDYERVTAGTLGDLGDQRRAASWVSRAGMGRTRRQPFTRPFLVDATTNGLRQAISLVHALDDAGMPWSKFLSLRDPGTHEGVLLRIGDGRLVKRLCFDRLPSGCRDALVKAGRAAVFEDLGADPEDAAARAEGCSWPELAEIHQIIGR